MEAVVFPGAGELAERCRSFDWGTTHLGPVASWPTSLRTTTSIVLSSAFPSVVLWGPELVQIYNDGYAPIMGDKIARSSASRSRRSGRDQTALVSARS